MELVLEMQGKSFHPLCNHERLAVRRPTSSLNEMFGKMTAFGRKLRLSEMQLRSGYVTRF
jgi:hypothetical protein